MHSELLTALKEIVATGAAEVFMEFYGSGDDGAFEGFLLLDQKGAILEKALVSCSTRNTLQEQLEDLVCGDESFSFDNEGCEGKIVVNLESFKAQLIIRAPIMTTITNEEVDFFKAPQHEIIEIFSSEPQKS